MQGWEVGSFKSIAFDLLPLFPALGFSSVESILFGCSFWPIRRCYDMTKRQVEEKEEEEEEEGLTSEVDSGSPGPRTNERQKGR